MSIPMLQPYFLLHQIPLETSDMTIKLGPYIFPGIIDCGYLIDLIDRDVAAAKAKSREDVLRVFEGVKAGHADWLEDYNLSGHALRHAGSPFSAAYDHLERWLAETAPPKPKRPKHGFVYMIGMDEDATAVKIGFATDVDDRRSTLQTSSHHSLKILAVIKGTQAKEKELHRKFAVDHIRGEWFRRSEAIEAFIVEIEQRAAS
jgi:hypothetical protein